MWRINGNAKIAIPKEDLGKFYGGDCYIVLYGYHSGERKEEYFIACWMGKESAQVKFQEEINDNNPLYHFR